MCLLNTGIEINCWNKCCNLTRKRKLHWDQSKNGYKHRHNCLRTLNSTKTENGTTVATEIIYWSAPQPIKEDEEGIEGYGE